MSYDFEIKEKVVDRYSKSITSIIKLNVDRYFELIELNFPMGLNRINWEEVENHRTIEVNLKDELNSKFEILNFFQELKRESIVNESDNIFVFGDGSIENVYKMPFYVLEENVMEFFTLPQHTYIINENADWCINYTFEDDLFFGFSSK